jgi:hypothetical protein
MNDDDRPDDLAQFFRTLARGADPDAALRIYLGQAGPRGYIDGLNAIGRVTELANKAIERLHARLVRTDEPAQDRHRSTRTAQDSPRTPEREPVTPPEQAPELPPEPTVREPEPSQPEVAKAGPSAGPAVVKMLRTLKPNYRDIRHVAPELAATLGVTSRPRAGSRGNALLYVLDNYAPPTGVSLEDLVVAFETMNVFSRGDPENRRRVNWEVNALQRKGWPILRDGAFYWLDKTRPAR